MTTPTPPESNDKRRPPNMAIIEDALFLFRHGVDPPLAAQRMGFHIQTIRTNFWRAHMPWPWEYDAGTKEYTFIPDKVSVHL